MTAAKLKYPILSFIIYLYMYCQKYRPYYTKRIAFSKSLRCDFPIPYHACLTCKLQEYMQKKVYLF